MLKLIYNNDYDIFHVTHKIFTCKLILKIKIKLELIKIKKQ